jgi:hypothetical protein
MQRPGFWSGAVANRLVTAAPLARLRALSLPRSAAVGTRLAINRRRLKVHLLIRSG